MAFLATRGLLAASKPGSVDGFSYHHYGAVSLRCSAQGNQTTREAALSEDWLGRTDQTLALYRALRDEFAPGTPFWNTETAEPACGGNPWANTFVDSFRYLDQLWPPRAAGCARGHPQHPWSPATMACCRRRRWNLAINNSHSQPTMIELPVAAERYTLSAPSLDATSVRLNGQEMKLGRDDAFPTLRGKRISAGKVELAPESITFLALAKAGNASCR